MTQTPVIDALAPWLQDQLRVLAPRQAHALLLTGAPGMGQFELAAALAKSWLCEAPIDHVACGQCAGCHAVDVHTHADFSVLMPETIALEQDWPLSAAAQDAIDKKERKPSRWIRVDAAREVLSFAQVTRSRAPHKVILIYPAERMNHETANTLLKTLEEPPPGLRFVLATEASHALLPTIRSRCQAHTMACPQPEQIAAWLSSQTQGANANDMQAWLYASGGIAHSALTWAQRGLTHSQWQALPRQIAAGQPGAMADWDAAEQLQTLLKIAHDLMAKAAGGASRFFADDALPPSPDLRALAAWQQRLIQASRTVEHPFNPGLMLEAWLSDAQSLWTR